MLIKWLGHACFRLSGDFGSVVIDPYAPGSVPGLEMPAVEADAVICSHGHSDHNYAQGVSLSGKQADFALTQIKCFHDEAKGAKRGENLISLIEADGLRVLHMGDLGHELDEGTIKALSGVDVLLVPVGGYFTIDAKTAFALTRAIGPKICVPMHYRGDGFGYEATDTVEPFAALCGVVTRLDASAFDPAGFAPGTTLILRCPGVEDK